MVAGGRLRHPPVHVARHVGERHAAEVLGADDAVRDGEHVAEVGLHGAAGGHAGAPVHDHAHAALALARGRGRPGAELPQVRRERLQLRAPRPRRGLQRGDVRGGYAVDPVDGAAACCGGGWRRRWRGAARREQAVDEGVGGRRALMCWVVAWGDEGAAERRGRRWWRRAPTGGCGPRDEEHVEGVGVADAVVEGAADDGAAAPELGHLRAYTRCVHVMSCAMQQRTTVDRHHSSKTQRTLRTYVMQCYVMQCK